MARFPGTKFVIDPGHGGDDSGTPGTGSPYPPEKTLVLQVGLLLGAKLEDRGAVVKLTRETDVFIDLYDRADIANLWGADYFVSIHYNDGGSEEPVGIEVLKYPGSQKGAELAGYVLDSLITHLPDHKNRGLKDRGDLVVLNSTQMPACLVECEFISNREMHEWVCEEANIELMAEAIAEGLEMFVTGSVDEITPPGPLDAHCPACGQQWTPPPTCPTCNQPWPAAAPQT